MAGGETDNRRSRHGRTAPPYDPSQPRLSVAAERPTKPGQTRRQLTWGLVAVVVCAAIVVVSLLMYRSKAKTPDDGYGASRDSVSAVSDNAVIVTNGSSPKDAIDLYADAMCTNCSLFQQQFGQQINKAVDQGQLQVTYHLLDVDNGNSFSGNYSSRAAAALLCVGADTAAPRGTYLKFYGQLLSTGTQPQSGTGEDLTNAQLASLAGKAGATSPATQCVSSGARVAAAKSASSASVAVLNKVVGTTPELAVLSGGKAVNINSADWLTNLLAN